MKANAYPQQGLALLARAESGAGERRFGACVAAAHHDDVIFLRVLHGEKGFRCAGRD